MTPSANDKTPDNLTGEKNYLLKRKNFIYLFIVVVLAFGSKDLIINSLINIDEDHKEIVRVLAEQNMLSQRITKLGLLIQNDFEKDTIANSRPDSLLRLIPRWVSNHQWLLKHNIKHGEDDIIAAKVTEQIIEASKYVDIISAAGMDVLRYRRADKNKLDKAVGRIDYYELPYHALVEKSLNLYKAQMLEEHDFLTNLQYVLSVIAILVLVAGFVVLILPIFNKLTKEISLRKQVEINLTKAVQNYLVSETVLGRNKRELEEVNEAISRSALVTITDTDGTILKANRLFCEITGYSEEELIGQNHRMISSNHHPREFWKEFWMTIKSGNSWKGEVRNKTKDGRDIWLETVINPIMGEGGTIHQFLAIRFDITEKKRAERRAERLDSELRTISTTYLPIAIISTDKEGNIVLFSKGAEALLGYTAAEMVGKTPMEFHDHKEVMARNAAVALELKRLVSGFETFTVIPELEGFESRQWTYIKKDGTRFPVELVVSPLKNQSGQTTGYVGIATDISERIMAEKAMIYAKEQAEEANRSKSQFLANMSHEIRTPLNSILGFSELLSETIHEPKQQRQLNTIITSGRTLLSLINDLLNIAKIESGKVELELHETNLHQMANEVSHMFLPEVKSKNVHLSVETSPGFPETVLADDIRIRQVLVNLTGNAVKFTHQGFIRLFLESKPVEGAPNHHDVIIKVQDSGIGIDKKNHHKIFEAFHQVLDTTTSQYGGTGLGLSIAQKLVGLMDGTITVESEIGSGSTFTVTIPGLRIVKTKKIEQLQPALTEEISLYTDKIILIVDDVESNINLILDFLENYPCRKLIARGGAEAVVIARQNHPDLILMDLKMPVMDGWEATRHIRQSEGSKRTPIIACTANVAGFSLESELFDGVIIKPFKKNALLEELKKYMIQPISGGGLESNNIGVIREKIEAKVLEELRSRFTTRLETAGENVDVAEVERLLDELEEFLNRNQLDSMMSLVITARDHFTNFDLDALSESLKKLNGVIKG